MKMLAAIALPTLALDWTTKRWAECALARGPRALAGDFARFALAHNPGGAFSSFAGAPERARLALFGGAGAAALALLVVAYARGRSFGARVGAPLVFGGALGNLVDRFASGYVVDFVSLPHWPTFNVADVAICIGVALLALDAASARNAPPSIRTVSHS